jgi:hypothetical protein
MRAPAGAQLQAAGLTHHSGGAQAGRTLQQVSHRVNKGASACVDTFMPQTIKGDDEQEYLLCWVKLASEISSQSLSVTQACSWS